MYEFLQDQFLTTFHTSLSNYTETGIFMKRYNKKIHKKTSMLNLFLIDRLNKQQTFSESRLLVASDDSKTSVEALERCKGSGLATSSKRLVLRLPDLILKIKIFKGSFQ